LPIYYLFILYQGHTIELICEIADILCFLAGWPTDEIFSATWQTQQLAQNILSFYQMAGTAGQLADSQICWYINTCIFYSVFTQFYARQQCKSRHKMIKYILVCSKCPTCTTHSHVGEPVMPAGETAVSQFSAGWQVSPAAS
jgi:hypothetical protein